MKIDNKSLKHFLLASAIALALPTVANANPGMAGPGCGGDGAMQRGAHHGGHHGGRFGADGPGFGHDAMPPFLHQLDLSEAQRDKLFDIHHGMAPLMRNQAKIADKARDELRELAMSDRFDDAKAKALADADARAHAEMALLRARGMQQSLAVLTPEQRKQLREAPARRDCDRPGGMGDGRGMRGPGDGRGMRGPGSTRNE